MYCSKLHFLISARSSKRNFLKKWCTEFTWLFYNEQTAKAFCSVCMESYTVLKVKVPNDGSYDQKAYSAFVKDGYHNWKKALESFRTHERSNIHRKAVLSILSHRQGQDVSKMISAKHAQEKTDARICLIKIIESVRYLAVQGLALRGHLEEKSNFSELLRLRSQDIPQLKSWLERSGHKWIGHEIVNEILLVLSLQLQKVLVLKITKVPFYGIMADETTDISRKEQMSINFRIVDDEMKIEELFMGLYDISCTDSETLFKVVEDVLLRYQLKFSGCRGQCYDGASNVSGAITGLQTRVRKIEPRALFTHCAGHNLNLVSQDAMKKIPEIADLLSNSRELVTFVRGSAKRVNIFNNIKLQLDDDDEEVQPDPEVTLKPFCPTRWCVRVKSLKSIKANYKHIIEFCDDAGRATDDAGIKARGLSTYLNKFESLLLLQISIVSLEQVEELNETLQATNINFKSVMKRVEILKSSLNGIRTDQKFDLIWESILIDAKKYDIEYPEPQPIRKRKLPKRFDNNSTAYFPTSPKEKYRRIYYQVIDQIITSIDIRFDSETYRILSKMEDFATQKCDVNEIEAYLFKDGQCDFDISRLVLHRDMFFDIIKDQNYDLTPDLTKISIFLQNHKDIREYCSEYTKFIKLLLTSPQTVCIAERSFSGLRRQKTYLSSTSTQQRTNCLALLNHHREIVNEFDLDQIADDFISRCATRSNTFFFKSEM